ncbi:MAG: phosphonoacetaldehyde reductase [Methanomassiliicoccales archaeon]
MTSWSYFNPTRIVFRAGLIHSVGRFIPGERVVIITTPGSSRRGVVEDLERSIGERVVGVIDTVRPHPDLDDIDRKIEEIGPFDPDALVALGGGSAMDVGKAVSRMLASSGVTLSDHLREGVEVKEDKIPLVAVPTTAGTGSEVTPFATIWDYASGKKRSLQDVFPHAAILDPELTLELPPGITASSGLDSVSHALESIWNHNAAPLTILIATRSLRLSLPSLPRMLREGDDILLRSRMMEASLLAGMAISQTRTALAHSISYPVTLRSGLDHGLACGLPLPEILMFNAAADDGRLAELSKSLGYPGVEEMAEGIHRLQIELNAQEDYLMKVPDGNSLLPLIDDMFAKGRVENNLREPERGDVEDILRRMDRRLRGSGPESSSSEGIEGP